MGFEIVIEEEVAQSEFINVTDKNAAFKTALAMWANGEIEFKRDRAELWSATATIRRHGKFDEETVLTLPDDGLRDKSGFDDVKHECYQAIFIATLQTRFDLEAKSLDDAIRIFREEFGKGRFKTPRLAKSGIHSTYVDGELQLDRVYFVPEREFFGRRTLDDWKQRSRDDG